MTEKSTKNSAGVFYWIFIILVYMIVPFYLVINHSISFNNLPSMKAVLLYGKDQLLDGVFYDNLCVSLCRVISGFSLGAFLAILSAIFVSQISCMKKFFVMVFEILRPIPNAAWVPFSIIVFTSISESILYIVFISSFFPIYINTLRGIENVHVNYLRYAKSMGTDRISMVFEVLLPAAMSEICTGLLLGMSGTWLGLVMAELISGQLGVGYMLWTCYTLTKYEGVIFWMIIIGIFGALSSFLIRVVMKRVIRWEK